jgi:CRP-like cAMP-binding protein
MTDARPDLLAGLTGDDADPILALGTPKHLGPGEVLFSLGERADSLYLITRGRLSLTLPMHVASREESVLVEERGPDETIGWSALVPPYRFTLEARALLDVDVLGFSRHMLLDHLERRPAAGQVVMRNIAIIIGQRLQVLQAMWLREVQRSFDLHVARSEAAIR